MENGFDFEEGGGDGVSRSNWFLTNWKFWGVSLCGGGGRYENLASGPVPVANVVCPLSHFS